MVKDLSKINETIDQLLGQSTPHTTNIEPEIPAYPWPLQNRRVTSLQDVPLVLCIDDLMAVLCIGRNTAYELVRSGQIRSVRIGKNYRVPRDAVEEFLKK